MWPMAETLERAVAENQPEVALTILEREAIISVPDDTRTRALGFGGSWFRSVGRVRDGLV